VSLWIGFNWLGICHSENVCKCDPKSHRHCHLLKTYHAHCSYLATEDKNWISVHRLPFVNHTNITVDIRQLQMEYICNYLGSLARNRKGIHRQSTFDNCRMVKTTRFLDLSAFPYSRKNTVFQIMDLIPSSGQWVGGTYSVVFERKVTLNYFGSNSAQ